MIYYSMVTLKSEWNGINICDGLKGWYMTYASRSVVLRFCRWNNVIDLFVHISNVRLTGNDCTDDREVIPKNVSKMG